MGLVMTSSSATDKWPITIATLTAVRYRHDEQGRLIIVEWPGQSFTFFDWDEHTACLVKWNPFLFQSPASPVFVGLEKE